MSWFLLMTAVATATATPEPPKSAKECRRADMQIAARGVSPPPPARLDRLPAGNLELAVQREVDGCIEPTIIRYGVDLPPRR